MKKAALVIGGNAAGVQAALDLAESQLQVYLVERASTLGFRELSGGDGLEIPLPLVTPRLLAAANHPNIHLITDSEVIQIEGTEGDFTASIRKHPRFVSEQRCTGCGRCERSCPVVVRTDSESGTKAIGPVHPRAVPYSFVVNKIGTSPCRLACPGGINAHGYVALIAQGRFAEALQLILEAIPFPGVCGRVCNHPCESSCNRGEFDEPIAVCALKRFVADESWDQVQMPVRGTPGLVPRTGEYDQQRPTGNTQISEAPCNHAPDDDLDVPRRKVAIVGSGPAGLSAAWSLAKMGYAVTVFESLPVPGGMLATCIPSFRLPRDIVRREIDYISRLGVETRTSVTVGRDVSFDQLATQGFEAVFVGIGAHRSRRLGVPGDSLPGVVDCISLLKGVNLGEQPKLGHKVVVIGGGNAAIDAARTATRLKVESVRVLYRRSRADMPANEEEIREAEKEGVEILHLIAPKRIVGENHVTGVECVRCQIEGYDSDGRGKSAALPDTEFVLEADTIVLAIGQETDFSLLPESLIPANGARVISADPNTLATGMPGVFAGGDAVIGAGTVIEAIASGKRAAQSIDRYLRGEEPLGVDAVERVPAKVDPTTRRSAESRRQGMPCLSRIERTNTFDEVELGFTAEMAIREAERCLNCAGCSECMQCVESCELDALVHDEQTQTISLEVGSVVFAGELEANDLPREDYNPQDAVAQLFVRGSAAAAGAMATLARYRPPSRSISYTTPLMAQVAPPSGNGAGNSHGATAGSSTGSPTKMARRIVEFGVPLLPPDAQAAAKGNLRAGVFLCECGGQIADRLDFDDVQRYLNVHPGVVRVSRVRYACSDAFKKDFLAECESHGLNLGIVASCACCSLEQICYACTQNKIRCKQGLTIDDRRAGGNKHIRFEFVNIREQCAFVHGDSSEAATDRAKALIAAALAGAVDPAASIPAALPVSPIAAILGDGYAATGAAARIAAQGFETHLVSPGDTFCMTPAELDVARVTLHQEAHPRQITGEVGSYEIALNRGREATSLRAGVVIIDGASVDPATLEEIGRSLEVDHVQVQNAAWLRPSTSTGILPPDTKVPGIFFCQPSRSKEWAQTLGAAAASRASALLGAGEYRVSSVVAEVSADRCRWCGECQKACPFSAIRLVTGDSREDRAQVNRARCRGCAICVPRCNTQAIGVSGGYTGMTGRSLDLAIAALVR